MCGGDHADIAISARGDLDMLEFAVRQLKQVDPQIRRIEIGDMRERIGLWGHTHEVRWIFLRLYDEFDLKGGARFVFEGDREWQTQQLREQIGLAPIPADHPIWVDHSLLTMGYTQRRRTLWSGYAINSATIIGLGLIGWGGLGTFVAVRARRRVKAHQCVKCRYDLRGLAQARCPE